ncbi:multidrug transporter [Hyaloscypha variabilis F]|uniref:Multidrug transporter n=1 Tax=Hyaloscypha variabilis (strain UAMH 11265 / GT02V1 / F) TaxID=1149755 RepID=A0A2J6QWU2_HYAVF|nr:multidrug transporter [Hyaloscypha variabilis F]
MKDTIRESAFGQLVKLATGDRYLQYIEEGSQFQLPYGFDTEVSSEDDTGANAAHERGESVGLALDKMEMTRDVDLCYHDRVLTRDIQVAMQRTTSQAIQPKKTADDRTLVDWYTTDDPENPYNWSSAKKFIYSFAVYFGSSVYSPASEGVMKEFGVGNAAASLGLAIYVLAYGMGPMLFSPLSEIPAFGRNPIYVGTLIIFVILTIPAALVHSFPGLLILRFWSGFFGSPCLATGAATFQDMYPMIKVPYSLAFWAGSVTLGPALAPIIAGFSISAEGSEGWHWISWEMLWLSAPICLIMLISLPETSSSNILLRRARRLRKVTGNGNLFAQSEIDQVGMNAGDIAYEALIKPWQINALDPAVAFTTLYTALVYGIFYSFFEAFPLVFPVLYGFNLGESSLPFPSVVVALLICMPAYCGYYYYVVEPQVKKTGFGLSEQRLIPGLVSAFFVPIGLFVFAWTANGHVHWIVPTIGVGLVMVGAYTIMQSIFMYLPFTYPQYAASLFAANDFARSAFAAGCIIFTGPMFRSLGVAKGCTLLAGLSCGCTVLLYFLFYYGASLRKRSRFAVK